MSAEDAATTERVHDEQAHQGMPGPEAAPPSAPEPATHPAGPANGVGALQGRLAQAMNRGDLDGPRGAGGHGVAALLAAPVTLRAVLGEARVSVSRFLSLDAGDTLALDRAVGEPIDVTVNDTVIARGEIVMLDEEAGTLGIRVVALDDGRP